MTTTQTKHENNFLNALTALDNVDNLNFDVCICSKHNQIVTLKLPKRMY